MCHYKEFQILLVILIANSAEVFANNFVNLTSNFYSGNDSQEINNSFFVSIYQKSLLSSYSFVLHFPKYASYILTIRLSNFLKSSSVESTCRPIKMGVYITKHWNGDFIFRYPFIQYGFTRKVTKLNFRLIPIKSTSVFLMSYLHKDNCIRISALSIFVGIVAYDTEDNNTCSNGHNRIHVFYENKNYTLCVNQLDKSVYRLLKDFSGEITIEEPIMLSTDSDDSTTSMPSSLIIETSTLSFLNTDKDGLIRNRGTNCTSLILSTFFITTAAVAICLISYLLYQCKILKCLQCCDEISEIWDNESADTPLTKKSEKDNCEKVETTSLHLISLIPKEKSDYLTHELIREQRHLVNVRDKSGRTPLHHACIQKRDDIVKLLLSENAAVNLCDTNYRTALHYACIEDNDMWSMTTESEFVENHKNSSQCPNSSRSKLIIVKLLLQKNANVNLQDDRKRSALHYACIENKESIVELLLKAKANANLQDHFGRTPLEYRNKTADYNARYNEKSMGLLTTTESSLDPVNPVSVTAVPALTTINNSSGYLSSFYELSRHNPRGICLIINNVKFQDSVTDSGSNKDVIKIAETFGYLKYDIRVANNVTVAELKELIDEISTEDHTQYDGFVMFLMSSGQKKNVYCSDGQSYDVTEIFNSLSHCQTLQNKPKLIFLQGWCKEIFSGIPDTMDFQMNFNISFRCVSDEKMEKIMA